MFKRIISLILCMCLILTSCSKPKTDTTTNSNEDNLTVDEGSIPEDDKFELSALKSDKLGIDISTDFQLISKDEINKKYIEDNLQIIPEQKFKVEKLSTTVHNIIPLNNLENDKIYQVKINEKAYEYSWAFQTKKKFEIESTIPGESSSYVPENSGIEMYFTLGNLDKIDDFFEISPKIEGKFIQNDNCIIFVPEQLEKNTKYTITIKKGFGLKDSEEKLKEDYTFSFNTNMQNNSHVFFDRPLTNIYENNTRVIESYTNDQNENIEYNINIYQYKNVDAFSEQLKYFADTGKMNDIESVKELVKLNDIKQKPIAKDKSYFPKVLFQLPEELVKGYYLLEFNRDGSEEKYYHFLQINDMLIYNAFFDNQIFVVASDGKTSQGINKAEVMINGEHLGYTDEKGTLLIEKDTSEYRDKTTSIRVKAKGYNDFIYTESLYFYDYYYRTQSEAYKYLRYIDTDRPVYLPTDKINVWGFARHKDNKSINKVKVELVELNTNLVLECKYADLTDIGTYQTEFVINNITSEMCMINVYDNDIKILSEYITISKYSKPLYTLNGDFNKDFVYSGENVDYKIKGNFFDGNPVPYIKVNLSSYYYNYDAYNPSTHYENINKQITLDKNGEAFINVNTDIISDNWRPVTISMSSTNGEAEDKTVSSLDTFEIFPKKVMLEVEHNDINSPDSVNILFHELDNSKYKSQDYKSYEDLRGKPLDDEIFVEVFERYYEKVKKGEHYDFINKVNVIDYDYNLVQNLLISEVANTVDGVYNLKIPNYNSDRMYTVVAYYTDSNGNIKEEVSVGMNRYYYEQLYYSLEKTDDKLYRLNDNANFQLKYDNENVENIENDKLIILSMRNGLVDYKTSDDTNAQLAFEQDYIPNVMLSGIYIKNGYMYPVEYLYQLCYDRTQRQIHFDVTTDKEKYSPGEEVIINIKAKDEYNNPVVADVNISVVDEAYLAVFNKNVETLYYLYEYEKDNGLKKSYLSNIDLSAREGSGAEMGGGGDHYGFFRDEFKDTNIFKTVTTDKNGNASLKFKLADNLTSWRITYQGISDKQYAGSGTKNITVSLPFYVNMIMGEEYLKEDEISVTLRVFGNEATQSEKVVYKLIVTNKETGKEFEYSKAAVIGEYTNILLDKLDVGNYEILASAYYKDFIDGIKEEFKVVDSSIYFNNTDYYKLTENTVLDEVHSNPVITLFNESNSDFYNSLKDIASSSGNRIDQTVCSMIANRYINEYFKTDIPFNEDELYSELSKYEAEFGGYRLLTYSETDAELSSKLIHLINNDYLDVKSKIYFKNVLDSNEVFNTDVAASLWGLSKYKEPILLTIYNLLENEELEEKDKIYLSLALVELGDKTTAKKHYKELIENSLVEVDDYLYFDNISNDTDEYELTALLSVLGVKLKNYKTSDKLFKYIYNNPSKYTLSNMEQLIYIMSRDIMKLDEIKDLFGEVTVTINGVKKTYQLKLFDRESFAVMKEEIKDIKFSNIKGDIVCKVEALGNKDDLDKNRTEDISLNISYQLKESSVEKTNYNLSDIVKVTINPCFSDNVERGNYEITYIVPAGFRFVDIDRDNPFRVEENGQKLKFNFYYDKENFASIPIVFYIQAAQTGEYTVDYVVIKEHLENKLNYLDKSTLKVQ